MAQDAPSQAPLRAARHARSSGGADEAGIGAAARDRRSELPALDGRVCLYPSRVRLAGRAAWRLARPAGRLAADPLRAEEDRGHASLPALHASLTDWRGRTSTRIAAAACSTRQTISEVR